MKTRTNFFKKIFIISITILFLGGFSLYGYQRAKAVITGPSLILDNKELIKGFTSPSPDITLTGTAKNTAHLSINGEKHPPLS
jgi:hypothetical protein